MINGALPDVIVTQRLVLRPSRESDVPDVFAGYARDPEVTRYLLWRPHLTMVETEAFIVSQIARRGRSEEQTWVITRAEEDRALGMIGLGARNSYELGYVLARPEWGKGYMTEAVKALADLALAQDGIYRVFALCDVENLASARVLDKAGFELEGRLGRHTIFPNISAAPRDVFSYAKVR